MRPTLCSPIIEKEVCEAIGNLQRGKSPGPDGFSAEFYKQFVNYLVQKLPSATFNQYVFWVIPKWLSSSYPKHGSHIFNT